MESGGYSFAPGMKVIKSLHGLRGLLGNQPDVLSLEGRTNSVPLFSNYKITKAHRASESVSISLAGRALFRKNQDFLESMEKC